MSKATRGIGGGRKGSGIPHGLAKPPCNRSLCKLKSEALTSIACSKVIIGRARLSTITRPSDEHETTASTSVLQAETLESKLDEQGCICWRI